MNLKERIETAARAAFAICGGTHWEDAPEAVRNVYRKEARVYAESFAPELFADPPHWIAPWLPTPAMVDIMVGTLNDFGCQAAEEDIGPAMNRARDAYLNRIWLTRFDEPKSTPQDATEMAENVVGPAGLEPATRPL